MSHKTFDMQDMQAAKQGLLDNRCEHATKCHRTGKRKSWFASERARKGKVKAQKNMTKAKRYNAAARDYWKGLCDEHPRQR